MIRCPDPNTLRPSPTSIMDRRPTRRLLRVILLKKSVSNLRLAGPAIRSSNEERPSLAAHDINSKLVQVGAHGIGLSSNRLT